MQPGLCALEVLPRLAAGLGVSPANLELRPLDPRAAGNLEAGLHKVRDLFAQEAVAQPEELIRRLSTTIGPQNSIYHSWTVVITKKKIAPEPA